MERHKFYQEGVHWERIKQLGCGSSGTTYCIRDTESSFWLALKEVIIIMNIHVEEGGEGAVRITAAWSLVNYLRVT